MIRGTALSALAVVALVACGSPAPPPASNSGPGPAPVPTASARQAAMTQTEPPPPAPSLKPAPNPSPSAIKDTEQSERTLAPIAYDPKGRRDPFEQLQVTAGAKGLTVAAARLTGILRSERSILALVEAPDGIGYVMRTGDILGDGRLVEIGGDTAVFVVAARAGASPNRLTLRLNTE
jgi:Tfp pilus assembly protein PilP